MIIIIINYNLVNETLGDYNHLLLKTSAIKNINVKESLEKMIDMIEDENNLQNLRKNELDEVTIIVIKIIIKILLFLRLISLYFLF